MTIFKFLKKKYWKESFVGALSISRFHVNIASDVTQCLRNLYCFDHYQKQFILLQKNVYYFFNIHHYDTTLLWYYNKFYYGTIISMSIDAIRDDKMYVISLKFIIMNIINKPVDTIRARSARSF